MTKIASNENPSGTVASHAGLTEEAVMKVAHLARIQISQDEARQLTKDLGKSLEYFNQISKVDTTGLEPLVTPAPVEQYLRPDQVVKDCSSEELLANAPSREGQLFAVPPVL